MSAHHYFRDFAYCDSGMIPWLLIAERISKTGMTLAKMVEQRIAKYPCSGEINFEVRDAELVVQRLHDRYVAEAQAEDRTDGLSLEFANWRFNVRSSNTEPLLRLNVETRGDTKLLVEKTAELRLLITA
ncbi:UNVERIFIED_ORG: hypothetical protein RHOFW104R5_27250 [Rhodanobacter sp. FW104-R5]